ncbi:hypothetical protein DY000_02025475 [Brassica cretica]|uniref:Uncharacterized protein n=1 Tax=Brassica cretica TaxID=69181 RepID=A0ABQ7E7I9_BRACR|nr:hypothetical protein DY000_02025475 [Brassica cretica]
MMIQNVPDTSSLDYWLNWRVFLCAVWVLTPMIIALFVIWKFEKDSSVETQRPKGSYSEHSEDIWRPSLKQIHPGWLLGFRVLAFCFLLTSNIVRLAFRGFRIYYYYTQWTFTLITIYFGMGSLFSVYGCFQHKKQLSRSTPIDQVANDAEIRLLLPLLNGENMLFIEKIRPSDSKTLGSCVKLFHIIFQTSAGAAVLTDSIYWTVIFPFLSLQDYEMSFVDVHVDHNLLWVYGCFQHKKQLSRSTPIDQVANDAEIRLLLPLLNGENMLFIEKIRPSDSKTLGSCVKLFHIIFQTSAGAAVLTDSIYWTVIFPFLSLQDYEMSFVLLLHLVDRKFCYFPMASPCFYLRRVAISFSRPFNSHGSSVVSVGSIPASSFLCPLCIIRQNQTPIHILKWTFTLITIYFGMGSLFSVYGCFQHKKQLSRSTPIDQVANDAEIRLLLPLLNGENMLFIEKIRPSDSKTLGSCVKLFHIIFQTSAGAAVLTDSIYWTVIFPFLSLQDYEMSFMTVNLHTSNLVLLLCDTTLNRLVITLLFLFAFKMLPSVNHQPKFCLFGCYSAEISLVQVLLLHLVDRKFCYFPMASPCVYLRRVAISISGPVNSHGSSVVSVGSTPASSFLCPLCIIRQNQTPIHILK